MEQQLPENIMRKAVKGISYIAHPLRLRILEYLDVNGSSSVSVKSAVRLPRPEPSTTAIFGRLVVCILIYSALSCAFS